MKGLETPDIYTGSYSINLSKVPWRNFQYPQKHLLEKLPDQSFQVFLILFDEYHSVDL